MIHIAEIPLIILMGLGLFTRGAIGGLLVLQSYIFFADQLNFRNHPYFFLLVLVIGTHAEFVIPIAIVKDVAVVIGVDLCGNLVCLSVNGGMVIIYFHDLVFKII